MFVCVSPTPVLGFFLIIGVKSTYETLLRNYYRGLSRHWVESIYEIYSILISIACTTRGYEEGEGNLTPKMTRVLEQACEKIGID